MKMSHTWCVIFWRGYIIYVAWMDHHVGARQGVVVVSSATTSHRAFVYYMHAHSRHRQPSRSRRARSLIAGADNNSITRALLMRPSGCWWSSVRGRQIYLGALFGQSLVVSCARPLHNGICRPAGGYLFDGTCRVGGRLYAYIYIFGLSTYHESPLYSAATRLYRSITEWEDAPYRYTRPRYVQLNATPLYLTLYTHSPHRDADN